MKLSRRCPARSRRGNRNPVRVCPVLLDTTPGAGVAARAVIQVEHKNDLTFIKTLFDIVIEDSVTHG